MPIELDIKKTICSTVQIWTRSVSQQCSSLVFANFVISRGQKVVFSKFFLGFADFVLPKTLSQIQMFYPVCCVCFHVRMIGPVQVCVITCFVSFFIFRQKKDVANLCARVGVSSLHFVKEPKRQVVFLPIHKFPCLGKVFVAILVIHRASSEHRWYQVWYQKIPREDSDFVDLLLKYLDSTP